jgi:hypothetical protein
LVPAGDAVLGVLRPDGQGLDSPTRTADDPVETVARLHGEVLGGRGDPRLLGFVRNLVPDPPDHYPWPAPVASFAVWRVEAGRDDARLGAWLEREQAQEQLGSRHWWPLLADSFALRERPSRPGASPGARA